MIDILFVDDEPLILAGLKRALRSYRSEWNMSFAESGEEALSVLEERAFDVVVSDMKMPGMDGAELLSKVKERSPQTIRFILSGHAERESILRVVDPSHQFMGKPCNPEELKSAIDRAVGLRGMLNGSDLRELVSKMDVLPSLPGLYEEVMAEVSAPEPSMKKIGQIIEQDVSMSVKILKIVNSAFFGLRQSVSSIERAVMFLGLETVSALVLKVGIFRQFEAVGLPGIDLRDVWDHGQRVGAFARALSATAGLDRDAAAHAFTGGLVHDVGLLVLASKLPEGYRHVQARLAGQENVCVRTVERELLGASNAEVGAYLLALWGLAEPLVEAVAYHQRPSERSEVAFDVVTVVHIANALATADDLQIPPNWCYVDWDYLDAAGIGGGWDEWQRVCRAELDRLSPQMAGAPA